MCPRRRESSRAPRRVALDALSYLATKLPQHLVAIGLLNDALDAAIEAVTVLLRQALRRDHHHRDVVPVRPTAQLVEEFKSVHLRHHQIENDDVWPRPGDRLDRNLTVLRLVHFPSDRLQRLAHTAADHLVIIKQKGASRGRGANAAQARNALGTIDRS